MGDAIVKSDHSEVIVRSVRLAARGEDEAALALLKEALDRSAEFSQKGVVLILMNYGVIAEKMGDLRLAAECEERVALTEEDSPHVYLRLFRLHTLLGRENIAAKHLEKCVELAEAHKDTHLLAVLAERGLIPKRE
jgi:hypothetical protein